jgi:hypothetical protein
VVQPRGVEHGDGRLDGDERLGEPVADRLEHGDRAPELDPRERVLAGQLQHPPRRADQLVAEGELPERDGRPPVGLPDLPRASHVTGDLDQAQGRVGPVDRPPRERCGLDLDDDVRLPGAGHDQGGLAPAEACGPDTVHAESAAIQHAGSAPPAGHGEHHRPRTVPESVGEHPVER